MNLILKNFNAFFTKSPQVLFLHSFLMIFGLQSPYKLNKLFEADEEQQKEPENKKEQPKEKEPEEKKEEPEQPPEDIVYALSTMFDDKQIEEKLEILGDFISRINSIGV